MGQHTGARMHSSQIMAEVMKSLLDETLVDLIQGRPQTLAMCLNYVSYRPSDAEQGASSLLALMTTGTPPPE